MTASCRLSAGVGHLVATLVLLGSAACGGPATTASAQEQSNPLTSIPIVVGSRVRLQSTEVGGRLTGLVTALDDSSLTLSTEGGPPLKLRLASLTALDTSLGRRRHTLQGLAIGVLGGAVVGLLLPVDPNNCGQTSPNSCSRGLALEGGVGSFGLIGTVVGALVKSDRWGPVTLNATPHVQHGKTGLGVAVALRF